MLGKYLYIDGGEQVITGQSTDGTASLTIRMPSPYSTVKSLVHADLWKNTVERTLAIDLSISFSTTTKNNSIEILEISKGQCPNLNSWLFWNDESRQTVYTYGGWISTIRSSDSPLPSVTSFWAFVANDTYGIWQDFNQSSDSVFNSLTRPSFGSAASGAIGGFGLGGYESGNSGLENVHLTSPVPSPGLQFYNFTTKSWYNNSGEGYTTNGTSVYAGAIYLPAWGAAGLVAIFGGQTTTNRTDFVDGANYLPMSNISLFDVSSESWYYQEASGDIPSQRDRFCVVGASGGDKTTFEIFVYSGQAGNGVYDGNSTSMAHNAERDEVYILSLPAFAWFKANYTSVDPRIYHTCHVVGNQMMSIGGLNPSFASLPGALNDTDPFWEGIKVFDMTALEWTNYYNASAAPYTPSEVILSYYGGQQKYPSWSLSAVQDLFVTRNPSASSPTPNPRHGAKELGLKDTIAVSVGGVGAFLLCLAGFILLIVRRKRERTRRREEAKGRLPAEHTRDQRQVPEGVCEADDHFQPAEADRGEPRTPEMATGQQVPQEVDAIELRNLFELENPRGNELDGATAPLELGRRHADGNIPSSVHGPLELESSTRHRNLAAMGARTELEALLK